MATTGMPIRSARPSFCARLRGGFCQRFHPAGGAGHVGSGRQPTGGVHPGGGLGHSGGAVHRGCFTETLSGLRCRMSTASASAASRAPSCLSVDLATYRQSRSLGSLNTSEREGQRRCQGSQASLDRSCSATLGLSGPRMETAQPASGWRAQTASGSACWIADTRVSTLPLTEGQSPQFGTRKTAAAPGTENHAALDPLPERERPHKICRRALDSAMSSDRIRPRARSALEQPCG
jgi:hypothetical protein